MAPLEQVLALRADPLHQHREAAADEPPSAGEGDRPLRLEQPAVTAAGGRRRHPRAKLGRRRARLATVDEAAEMVEARPLDEAQQVLEVLRRSPGKPTMKVERSQIPGTSSRARSSSRR